MSSPRPEKRSGTSTSSRFLKKMRVFDPQYSHSGPSTSTSSKQTKVVQLWAWQHGQQLINTQLILPFLFVYEIDKLPQIAVRISNVCFFHYSFMYIGLHAGMKSLMNTYVCLIIIIIKDSNGQKVKLAWFELNA